MAKPKRRATRTSGRAKVTTHVTEQGRQYLVSGELDLTPSINVYLKEVAQIVQWTGPRAQFGRMLYRPGHKAPVATMGAIRDFDEAQQVLREAARRVITLENGAPVRVRRASATKAVAAALAGFVVGFGSTPEARGHFFGWMAGVSSRMLTEKLWDKAAAPHDVKLVDHGKR